MDTENNSTTSETLTKTSEGGVKLPQNPTDANRNPSTGSGDSAAVETLETEEDQTNSNDVQPVSTTVVDQDKLKDTMFKNVSNENDPNSEDIELKWDDDSDIDESVLDDSVPGLIDSLEMSINMTKSHEVMKSGDDGGKTSKDNAELELMDVDTSEIDEISNKIDELIKDNDDQACAKTNIDLIKSNEDQACAKPNIAMIKSNEEKSPKFNKDNDNIITNQESQDSTPGKEITDIIEEPMIVDTFNDEESELKENFEEKQFSLETKRSSEPTMQEKIAEEEPTCSSLELMESAAEKVQQLPTLTTSSPITFVKEDNILNKEDEHEMDLDTSEVTEITPDFNNVSGTKQSIEITHDDSKVVEMEQVTSVEKSNLTESPKAKSSMSILEDKQPVAGNTAEIIQEPDSSTEKLESKSDTLKKVYKSSKLSDVEDDDHIVPSKEEEDILLAEPTSTDDLVDALVIPSHVIDPIEDTSDGVNDAVDSVRNSSKNTDHVNPESSTIVTSLKESSIASGVVKKPTDAEETVVDTSDNILEVKDNFAVPTETITKDVEALKEQSDIEVMVNDALENHVDASEVPKTIETTSGLDKLTLFKEEVTESLTSVAKNIQADDSDKAQGDSDVSETISVPPMSSTDNALKNRAEIAPTTSDELLGMGDSSEVMAEASTLSETLKGESKAVLTSDGSDSIQVIPDNSDIGKITSNIEAMTTDVSDIDPKATESFIPSTSTEAEKMPQDTSEILSIAVNGVQVLPDTSDTIQKSWTSLDEIAKSSDTVKLTDEPSISPSNLNDNTKNSAFTSATPSIASDSVKELPETSDIVQKPPTNLDEVTISSDTVDLLEKPSTASETVPTASNSDQELPDTSNTVQKPPTSLDGVAKSSDSANHLEKPSTSTSDATDTLIISATSETIKMASDASGTDQKSPNCDAKTIQVPSDVTETPEQTANKPEKALSPKPSTSSGIQPPLAPDTSADLTQMTDNQGLLSESAKPLEDTSDEVPEFTDSLGLLAESSGPMDEEEEPDMEDEDDADDDEEPEDDQDDESNHPTTADQSEDSNAQTSETDAPNPIDIEISEDSFADKLRATEMVVDDMLGGTEKVNEAGDIDVDKEFDKLIASVMPGKQKIVSEAEQLKSPDKPDDSMDVDDAKPTDSTTAADGGSVLRKILTASKDVPPKAATPRGLDQDKGADTPTKAQKLARCSNGSMSVVNIVDLEESSSEDDVLDTTGDAKPASPVPETDEGSKEDAVKQDSTVVKPAAPKAMLRLNTDELTIKTAVAGAESTLVIPEAKLEDIPQPGKPSTPKFSLEVFSLDSDEEDSGMKANDNKEPSPEKPSASANAPATAPAPARCGNPRCADSGTAPALKLASKRAPALCENCTQLLEARLQALTQGVMDLTPLLRLEAERPESELVEISDSDSDDGGDDKPLRAHQPLGQLNAKYLEEELADMINETWRKYKLDDRLTAATDELASQMAQLEKDQVDVNTMLDECQVATDTLRRELYAAFAVPQRQLPSIEIFDTIHAQYAKIIDETESSDSEPVRRSKRPRVQSKDDNQAKRPAIPLGFTGDDMKKEPMDDGNAKVDDDNTDIKVIALSAEAAPTGLPALGTLTRQPVAVGMTVFAMKHAFGAWQKATVLQAPPRGNQPYTTCKVRFEHKSKTNIATISARHLAYAEPASVRLTIGTRVIALFCDIIDQNKRKSYYSGVVAEMPNPVNSYRYLVFFDDGYAQYVSHSDTRVVCECSPLVWEEVHPFSREFVHTYLRAYPERPMVRLHAGQTIKTEWNGKWWVSRVIQVDASLVQVHFEADNRYEWIYRGSTRLAPLYLELQAAEKHRARPLPRSTQGKRNMPYVEYTRFDEQDSNKTTAQLQLQDEEIKRQRAVAKKSTGPQNNQQAALPALSQDAVMSRVVYYTPKAAVKPHKMIPHTCSIKCKRTDVLPLKELRTYNPLARPLLSGWERQLVRHKGRKEVMYRAPCGRRLRNVRELHRYLRATAADMAVDLFDFSPATHCLAEFVLNRCLVSKKDLSHGKENVPVPCVNYYDTSLPEFCSYNTERTPTAGVPLNLDPEFLCGCDCDDDCQDKTKCKCWQMTLGGARTVGQDGPYVGYLYKRLLEPVPSGIYECNSRCKCKHTCLNRVAQHPLQLKLQVFKTPNRGWGIRALNDVPKGAFLCVYAGNLLTDATANLDGLNEGDEYLAELDYIEVVEQMKEGYEEDVPEKDKELDRASKGSAEAESDSASSSEDERKADQADGDFRPLVPLNTQQTFSKRLRRREKKTKDNEEKQKEAETKGEQPPAAAGEKEKGDCITISDDEEVREPSRFMAQTDMGDNEHVSKYRSVRSLYGKDEACYIMDAKVQGNIGRYLNHSCCPNVFVQNVFVDTHDPRFPWVAFFALSHIRAGTELTWNYNYDVGSVPDKVLYCYCGAPNCRGRLL